MESGFNAHATDLCLHEQNVTCMHDCGAYIADHCFVHKFFHMLQNILTIATIDSLYLLSSTQTIPPLQCISMGQPLPSHTHLVLCFPSWKQNLYYTVAPAGLDSAYQEAADKQAHTCLSSTCATLIAELV